MTVNADIINTVAEKTRVLMKDPVGMRRKRLTMLFSQKNVEDSYGTPLLARFL